MTLRGLIGGCLVATAALAGCGTGPAGYRDSEIYCCSRGEVFAIDLDRRRPGNDGRVWTWTAGASGEILAPHRLWFRAADECKPVLGGSAVLICSSSAGAVALIRRADNTCLFYAGARNAHSAELIGDDLLAVACSYGNNQLRLYRLGSGEKQLAASPAWWMKLSGAHGVAWDSAREVLWALGGSELLKLKVRRVGPDPSAEVLKRWPLPSGGGHDLFALDPTRLVVTVNAGVHQFDLDGETFSGLAELAAVPNVTSVCRQGRTGEVIYVVRYGDRVRRLGGEDLLLEGARLYKARWNGPGPLGPEGPQASLSRRAVSPAAAGRTTPLAGPQEPPARDSEPSE